MMPRRSNIIYEKLSQLQECNSLPECNSFPVAEAFIGPDPLSDLKMTNSPHTMKSSRRKQSKPNRVSLLLEAADSDSLPSSCTQEKKSDFTGSHSISEVTTFSCDLCPLTFSSHAELTEHVQTEHASSEKHDIVTAYHILGQEFRQGIHQESHHKAKQPTMLVAHKANAGLNNNGSPLMSTESESEKDKLEENSMLPKSSLIFNADLYCTLCDREFRNKYLLQSHRANKHGIYDSTEMTSPTGPIFPGLDNMNGDQNVAQDLSKRKNVDETNTPLSNPPVSASIPLELEDYCEICQKHFCNKYYLKKHKLDVHGIKTESPSKSNQPSLLSKISSTTTLPTSMMSSVTSAPTMILPQNLTTMTNPVMFINPFMSPMALIPNPSMLHNQQVPQPFMMLPQLQQSQIPHVPRVDVTNTSTSDGSAPMVPVSTSPNNTAVPNDALRSIGVLNADAYCDICQKEFCNKYFLKIHKGNKHGMYDDTSSRKSNSGENSPRETQTFENKPISETQDARKHEEDQQIEGQDQIEGQVQGQRDEGKEQTNGLNQMTEEERFTAFQNFMPNLAEHSKLMTASGNSMDIFSNMMYAKMADRVMCDICNKEVCNKYFLRAHRMKIHGIMDDPPLMFPQFGMPMNIKQEQEPYTPPPPPTEQPTEAKDNEKSDKSNMKANMSTEELVRMGIDPEAYCDICKKEFCSKYFLKTHKLNIHGIRVDRAPVPEKPRQQTSMSQLSSMMNFTLTRNSPTPHSGAEQMHWRWKDTATNNPRVSCHVCNKELCNKYFLRTHMLNKHGMYLNDQYLKEHPSLSLTPPTSNPPSTQSTVADCLASLSSKISPTQNPAQIPKHTSGNDISVNSQIARELDLTVKPMEASEGAEKEEEFSQHYFSHFTEVCPVCDRHFKSEQSLQTHMITDHNMDKTTEKPADDNDEDGVLQIDETAGREFCHLCGMVCGDKESLEKHMSQEHGSGSEENMVDTSPSRYPQTISNIASAISTNVRLSLKRKYSKSGKHKLYSCSHCDYKTRWLSNIYSHEERKHSSGKEFRKHSCNECFRSFRYEHSLIRHLEMYHQNGNGPSDQLPDGSSKGSLEWNKGEKSALPVTKPKKFRCAHCGVRFGTKDECFIHIRTVHAPNSQKASGSGQSKSFTCQWCDYKTRYLSNLKSHCAIRHKVPGRLVTQSRLRRHLHHRFANLNLKLNSTKSEASTNEHDNKADQEGPIESNHDEMEVTQATTVAGSASVIMQSFKLECSNNEQPFLPTIVNLPVQSKVEAPALLTFSLTPTADI